MRKIRILSLVMAILLVAMAFAACGSKEDPVEYQPIDPADAVTHQDYTSVYDEIGSQVTIDMVQEDENGMATVTVDGVTYTLGMDFLSMAMVYNTQVPAGSTKYQSAEDVYNEWWKLYIQRWNYLVAEIPLYSNEYYDLYNKKIEGFVTTPFWGPADAIIAATVKSGENAVILGSATELSGAFRNSSWGKSSPGASDLDIENLTSGHATVMVDQTGTYVWNMGALAEEPTSTVNADGTLTYTIKIKDSLKFSDGSAITAKNYIAGLLCNSSPVGVAANGTGTSGLYNVGYEAFSAYTGEGDKVYFEGIKLLDDYTFSVTYSADFAGYYYAMTYAAFSPSPMALYLGTADIVVDANKSCGLSDEFYAKADVDGVPTYTMAAVINENLKWDSPLPYSGPYTVSNYDASSLTATLKINPNYSGDDTRGTPSIATITYVKTVSETQMDMFTTGQVDIVAGITGGTETQDALKIVNDHPDKYAYISYDRAGYGKIAFRGDFGPTMFQEVRQAVMYTIDRNQFAQTFTGGFGGVVHGAYYEGFPAYQAVKDDIILNSYTYSKDKAIEVLEAAGWTYNVKGKTFDAKKDDIRYKKLSGYELTLDNLNFATVDGRYKTVKIDGSYYMPLAINWYGTQPNDVTDQLIAAWQSNANATSAIGMYITYTSCDFTSGLYGEYLRMEGAGYDGVPKLNCINFATGFNSAAYDYSLGWTINQDMYSDMSQYYIMDEADFLENYTK